MPNSEPERYDRLTDAEHDDMVEAMGTLARVGDAAGKLAESFGYRRLSGTEFDMKHVLIDARYAGLKARDVLDMMEENDE